MSATPEMYSRVFEGHSEGILIMEDLTARFYDKQSFAAGQPDVTAFNEGRRAVIMHILRQLNQVKHEEPETDELT